MAQRIEIVRGTTNTFEITIVDSVGGAYNLGSNERVIFGVQADPRDETLLISKTAEIIGEGLFRVTLCPEDTEGLSPGRYSYDVGLDDGTDYFNVIEPGPFEILANVTFRGCAE